MRVDKIGQWRWLNGDKHTAPVWESLLARTWGDVKYMVVIQFVLSIHRSHNDT